MPDSQQRAHTTQMLNDLVSNKAPGGGAEGGLKGNRAAVDRLLDLVYEDLRALAASHLRREGPGHTLQPTALAHEVFMVLVDQTKVDWKGRSHFLAIASQAMRRILIDHARGKDRQKRGGGWKRIELTEQGEPASGESGSGIVDVEALDATLKKLAELDPRQARIVEMRYLAGMTVEEVAEALGVSKRTVEGDWTMARAWLRKELAGLG
jgi:RNA polymerase sigma-70 factor, ECF subfamily